MAVAPPTADVEAGLTPGLLVRSHRAIRRLERSMREASFALRELRRMSDYDLYARFPVGPDEEIEELTGGIVELLRHARHDNPGQEIEIIFVAREAQRGERNEGEGQLQGD